MPSAYAHYRFGAKMLSRMPADLRRTAARYRSLYDVGLHGPDPFFFYNPFMRTKTGALGHATHCLTGTAYFTPVCRGLRMEPSEAALAYLYGMLCHYALDSRCHPSINRWAKEGEASHVQIESEFDRYLMELDGKENPHCQDLTHHMVLTEKEAAAMARFFPDVTGQQAMRAVKNMAKYTRLLAAPEGPGREIIRKTLRGVSKGYEGLMVPVGPDPACSSLDQPLMELYRQAEEVYPRLLSQMVAHMTYNAPLGEEFTPTFG